MREFFVSAGEWKIWSGVRIYVWMAVSVHMAMSAGRKDRAEQRAKEQRGKKSVKGKVEYSSEDPLQHHSLNREDTDLKGGLLGG